MNKLAAIVLLSLALVAGLPAAAADKPRELSWDDLMPEYMAPPPPAFPGAGIPGQSAGPTVTPYVPMYSFNPVKELDGQYVKLPGYVVPLESDEGGLLDEFLLVPYFGACIHVPPPPPNQIVYVKLKKPFNLRSMADPYWITGRINTQAWSSDIADSDYVLTADKVEIFEWDD